MIHYFQDLFYFTLNLDKLRVHLECVVLQQHWCTMLVFEEILSNGNSIMILSISISTIYNPLFLR